MANHSTPAFPTIEQNAEFPDYWSTTAGLTKREYFAAMAMQGILANGDFTTLVQQAVPMKEQAAFLSEVAAEQADALIEALNKS